ncbi:hypothetical protein [Microbacterium saperdae]|uniref:Uncharacterized protein n=1 Tax=Microbacterium saperdae TaxID=69368 RepID=A0A543BIR5_9MICO|nr:hypothetical protein [Microbacterium saperdae]TQL84724.1 hypothetical protein FB560_0316 [Microbacterium saperdae]GGM64599.1 hypothetical protein GCM10010489_40240 [Microbacterium saperdae]
MPSSSLENGRAASPAKHVWIELIGFDNTLPDFGVGAVLGDMGERPERLSLLLFSAEFVHAHADDDDGLIPTECTSYAARPVAVRGPRQDWTRAELRGLVRGLQDAGVAVFFAIFDLYQFELDGHTQQGGWNRDHPELTVTDRTGAKRHGLINPLGRLADGSAYVDTLVAGLTAVFAYYGFDGLHGADGLSSPRLPLWAADFSDDMIAQFEEHRGALVPAGFTAERATWIWASARQEWISFIARRWEEFWTTVADSLHRLGATVMLNNAWMRDPFEALYRFGVDYRTLVSAGVDGFVLETVAAGVEMLEAPTYPPIHGQMAAVLLIRAHLPHVPLAGLVSVHDTYEQWDVVHTAPAMLERDQRLLTALRAVAPAASESTPCLDASLYCLADGISPDVWAHLDRLRTTCDAAPRVDPGGFTLLYSPSTLEAEVERFIDDRVAHTHTLLSSLFRAGAVVGTVAPAEEHQSVRGPVLILRPDLYPDELLAEIHASHDRVVSLGPVGTPLEFAGSWRLTVQSERESGAVAHTAQQQDFRPSSEYDEVIETWLIELPMQLPPSALVAQAASVLRPSLGDGGPLGTPGASTSVQVVVGVSSHTSAEVILHNTEYRFRDAQFTAERRIVGARSLSGDVAFPVRYSGHTLTARVPPKGVVAIRLQLEDDQ